MQEAADHARFAFSSLGDLRAELDRLGLELPLSEDVTPLAAPLPLGRKTLPNRLCVLPMEGCDATYDGAPGDLTRRRYRRFAEGGAGLVWFEADAVVAEGRANPRQLYLTSRTLDGFAALVADFDCAARTAFPGAPAHQAYKVLQLTHSGRYSRPDYEHGEAVAAAVNPLLDPYLPPQHRVVTDAELADLVPAYVNAAVLAKRAGFDAVDVKACNGYLLAELLGARTRPGSYGGSFENRVRLPLDIVDAIAQKTGGLDIAVRMNAYDALPLPYGFGVSQDPAVPDLEEPIRLLEALRDRGVRLVSISVGNPYYNPHVGRPYDAGYYTPRTSQLADTARILAVTRDLRRAVPGVALVSAGLTWLREYGANVAAGLVRDGWCDVAGFGRQSLAYPGFARDLLLGGALDRKKCCLTCSNCTHLMRAHLQAGCPVRDPEIYAPLLKQAIESKGKCASAKIDEHI